MVALSSEALEHQELVEHYMELCGDSPNALTQMDLCTRSIKQLYEMIDQVTVALHLDNLSGSGK